MDILLREMQIGRMNRREFLDRAAALGVGAAAATFLLRNSAYAATPNIRG